MRAAFAAVVLALLSLMPFAALAQTSLPVSAAQIVEDNREQIEKPSRQTIGPVIAALAASGDPQATVILSAWANRTLGIRKGDGVFVLMAETADGYALRLLDGSDAGTAPRADITELRPNAGVRGVIATALVQFQLNDPNPARRADALTTIARDPAPELLGPLRASIEAETDPTLRARKDRLNRLLTLRFDPEPAVRLAAIESFSGDLGIDLRAALNPLLATTRRAAPLGGSIDGNIARDLDPGSDLTEVEAYDLLVAANLAPARLTPAELKASLASNIVNGSVAGIPLADLNTQSARNRAYTALEVAGTVPVAATDEEVTQIVAAQRFVEVYS